MQKSLGRIIFIVSGHTGGVRAAIALRPCLAELGTMSTSYVFSVPFVHQAIEENGVAKEERLDKNCRRLITQVDWYAKAMKNHTQTVGKPEYVPNYEIPQ